MLFSFVHRKQSEFKGSGLFAALKHEKRFLVFGMVLALCIRLILFFCYTQNDNYKITIDSDQYHEVAVQISQGNGITLGNGAPNFFRLPAYPIFLGILYKIFDASVKKALLFQLFLSVFVLPLIFFLAFTLFPSQILVAKMSFLVAALHPGAVLFSGLQATETLFILFFLIFLILLFNAINFSRNVAYFFLSGVVLGIASLFRALGQYLIIISILLTFLFIQKDFYKRLSRSIFLFAGWVLVFGVWIIRNYLLTGFIFIHTLTGQHFLRYNAVHILMDVERVDWSVPHKKLFDIRDKIVKDREKTTNRKLLDPELDQISLQVALDVMKKHPMLTLKHACKQILMTCFQPYFFMLLQLPPGTIFNKNDSTFYKFKMYALCLKKYPIIIFFILLELFFYIFIILGMLFFIFFCVKNYELWRICKLIFPFIFVLLLLTLSYGCSRLRLPAEPFFIILACYGFVRYLNLKHVVVNL